MSKSLVVLDPAETAACCSPLSVQPRYAQAANAVISGGIAACGDSCQGDDETGTGSKLYDAGEQSEVPENAVSASLGCGNPIAAAGLQPGETVLDLGSGGGIDVLLSARRVGPAGKARGLDMTDEMLNLARDNAAKAGATNTGFLHGHIESIPLPDESVDVIISNCNCAGIHGYWRAADATWGDSATRW